MSTLLHQLRRERVEISKDQRVLLEQAIRRLLLDEVHEIRVSRKDRRILVQQYVCDRAQSVE